MATESPSFHSAITHDRHDALVRFVAATLLSLSICSVVLRLVWIRHPLRSLFGKDDLVTILCAVFASIQTGCLLSSLSYGFAQRNTEEAKASEDTTRKIIFAADALYAFALCLSRLASSLFCQRLTRAATWEHTACAILSGIMVACSLLSIFVVTIQSPYGQPWETMGHNSTRWTIFEATGILFEVLLFAFVSTLVWRLQMVVEKKIAVTIAFSSRLPVAAFALLRLRSLYNARDLADFNWEYAAPQIWAQLELHYSLMAATIPSLHIILKNLTTGWLADLKDRPETSMALKSSGQRYGKISVLRSNKMTTGSAEQGTIVELQNWTDNRNVQSNTFARRDTAAGDDAASDGSGRHILVHRTVDIDHGMN